MLKNMIKVTVILGLLAISVFVYGGANSNDKVKIYISQGAKHPALDETTKGLIDELKKIGYDESNSDIQIEYAAGNMALGQQIAAKFVSKKPNIVVGVATSSAQSFVKYVKNNQVKMIFTTVTDPVGASLVSELDNPGVNISGVSNFIKLEPQLQMFKDILPNMRKLGFLYNPSEANSVSLLQKLEEICPEFDLILIPQIINQTADVMQATAKLASNVDAIFISNDSTALSSMQVIVKGAKGRKIPVFVSDTDVVKEGALAALGPNQYEIGTQTARMIQRALKGEQINKMPVEFPSSQEIYLNKKAAEELGISFPRKLIDKADKIL